MNRLSLRVFALLLATALAAGLVGCRSDVEVERTKLPNIDGSGKPAEKSK